MRQRVARLLIAAIVAVCGVAVGAAGTGAVAGLTASVQPSSGAWE